jgi:sugar phosphate isomerase/epimerase
VPSPVAACEWIFGDADLPRTVARLAAAGYDGIEIIGEPGRPDVGRLESLVASGELRVAGTTAHSEPLRERDLAHPEREVRRLAVAYYRGCAELAARLGAPTIGLLPSAEGRLAPLGDRLREWKLAVDATRDVAHFAGERGVSVAVEPLNRYEAYLVNRVEQALAFAEEVGVVNTGIVADVFHMNIEEADVEAALELARGRLLEIHLADSNRGGLGAGHLPLERLLRIVSDGGFGGPYIVEITVADDELDKALAESAALLRRHLA